MSTQADHCILGGVQTYITLESAVLVATVGRSRAAGSGTWVFSGRSRAGGWRGGGGGSGGHLKIDRLNKKVQIGVTPLAPSSSNREAQWTGVLANKEENTRD